MDNTNGTKEKFYQKSWFMWICLFLFAPSGIFLMWKYGKFKKIPRIVLSLIFGFWFLILIIPTNSDVSDVSERTTEITEVQQIADVTSEEQNTPEPEIVVDELDNYEDEEVHITENLPDELINNEIENEDETSVESTDDESAKEDAKLFMYTNYIAEITDNLSNGHLGISSQSSLVGKDPLLLIDSDWKTKTSAYIDMVNNSAEKIIDYDMDLVPIKLKDGHDLLVLASKDYKIAMDYYTDGIDNFEADKIGKSIDYILSANEYMNKAIDVFSIANQ